jgi:hypothetical protein
MSAGETRNKYKILVRKPSERDNWQDLRVYGRIILKWAIYFRLGIGKNCGVCEYLNKRSISINYEKFLH